MRAFMEKVKARARRCGRATTIGGRIRQLADINSRDFTARARAERQASGSVAKALATGAQLNN